MALLQRTPGVLFLFVLGGGLFGGLLGETFLYFAPHGLLRETFLKSYSIGIPPVTLDLFLATLTLGFTLRFNIITLLGILLGIYTYKYM